MSYSLFISDIHLDPGAPEITRAFKHTLATTARHADALYILGDLFEVWIGDDNLDPFNLDIINTLRDFTTTSQVPTYFMRGNRDFLVGKRFAKMTGMTLLTDPTVVDLYGHRVILLHGDTLCTNDHKYQNFRRKTHHPLFKPTAYAIPLFLRRKIAKKMRSKSIDHFHETEDALMDACEQEVARVMQNHKVDCMIHGHTHRPKIHDNNRIVLGSWHNSAYELLFYSDQPPKMCRLPHASNLKKEPCPGQSP